MSLCIPHTQLRKIFWYVYVSCHYTNLLFYPSYRSIFIAGGTARAWEFIWLSSRVVVKKQWCRIKDWLLIGRCVLKVNKYWIGWQFLSNFVFSKELLTWAYWWAREAFTSAINMIKLRAKNFPTSNSALENLKTMFIWQSLGNMETQTPLHAITTL